MKNRIFKNLGMGVGLRSPHFSLFLETPPRGIGWVEVISENYMPWIDGEFGRSVDNLMKVRRSLPVALHGVSMNLGSADHLDPTYMRHLRALIDLIEPAVVSDHLSWTGVGGQNLHDLMPLPYTEECLSHLKEKILKAQDMLGRRILIENPSSYVCFESSSLTEAEFLSRLLKESDCGLLLDVNNVYVSSRNHGFDPMKYLDLLPAERVGQIHLAGHSERAGFLIDTHDQPVCAEVWDLYQTAIQKLGLASAMIERDDNIPEWSVMEAELAKLRALTNGENQATEVCSATA